MQKIYKCVVAFAVLGVVAAALAKNVTHQAEVREEDGGHIVVLAANQHNLVSLGLDKRIRLSDAGLREAGFSGAPRDKNVNPGNSDELRILSEEGEGSPRTRILMDGDGQFVYWTGGPRISSAEGFVLNLSEDFVVRTTVSKLPLRWTIDLER